MNLENSLLKQRKIRTNLKINYFEEIVFQKDIQLNNSINLGKIEIKTSTNLKEVIVGAEKKIMERKIDRFVFNVENSISAAGGTAMDVLRVTPGLNVTNDNIAVLEKIL